MKKDPIGRSLAASLDMPAELISAVPKISITGDGGVLIENHRGIRGFSAEKVCVDSICGEIAICGKDLQLSLLKKDEIVVEGELDSVTFLREGRANP